jgi:hypothetical protein
MGLYMPRVYDTIYNDAARAEGAIEDAYNKGDYKEVIEHIETLMNARYEFELVSSEWKTLADKYENLLVDEGRL